jgi:hypothetical protein
MKLSHDVPPVKDVRLDPEKDVLSYFGEIDRVQEYREYPVLSVNYNHLAGIFLSSLSVLRGHFLVQSSVHYTIDKKPFWIAADY